MMFVILSALAVLARGSPQANTESGVRVTTSDSVSPPRSALLATATCAKHRYSVEVERAGLETKAVRLSVDDKSVPVAAPLAKALTSFYEKRVDWGCYQSGALLTVSVFNHQRRQPAFIETAKAYFNDGEAVPLVMENRQDFPPKW